jgi:hypothetical protein
MNDIIQIVKKLEKMRSLELAFIDFNVVLVLKYQICMIDVDRQM